MTRLLSSCFCVGSLRTFFERGVLTARCRILLCFSVAFIRSFSKILGTKVSKVPWQDRILARNEGLISLFFLVHLLHDEQMLLQSQSCDTKHRFHHYEHLLAPQERFVQILNVVLHVIAVSKIACRDCQSQSTVEQSLHIPFFQDSQAVELNYEVFKNPNSEPCNRDLMSSWELHKCEKYQTCHVQS